MDAYLWVGIGAVGGLILSFLNFRAHFRLDKSKMKRPRLAVLFDLLSFTTLSVIGMGIMVVIKILVETIEADPGNCLFYLAGAVTIIATKLYGLYGIFRRYKKYITIGWKLRGDVLMDMGQLEEAVDCLEKARELADLIGNPLLMWKTRYSLSQVYSKQGKPEAAKRELEQAVAVIEKMASKVSDTEVRETFLSSQSVQAVRADLQAL